MGLTAAELEDVFSLDEELLNEAFERTNFVPPVRRVPAMVHEAFCTELMTVAHTTNADGIDDVITFDHESYRSSVRSRYLQTPEDERAVASVLADFFSGKWAGDEMKPYTLTAKLTKAFKLPRCVFGREEWS